MIIALYIVSLTNILISIIIMLVLLKQHRVLTKCPVYNKIFSKKLAKDITEVTRMDHRKLDVDEKTKLEKWGKNEKF